MSSSVPVPPAWFDTMNLQLADDSVKVAELAPQLRQFIDAAGRVHQGLFFHSLVVTSANDGKHAPGSAHYKNGAVDLRSHDKTPAGQLLFGACLVFLGELYGVAIFDERATPSPHYHCELATLLSGG